VAKLWGLLFGVTILGCLLLFVVAALPGVGWWLPEGVSDFSDDVDRLYYVILAITGFFFILTEAILVFFMIRFGARHGRADQPAPPTPAFETGFVNAVKKVIPNEHRLELAWTIVPAAILLYIAFAQVGTWMEMKYQSRMPDLEAEAPPLPVAVSARQFEWRMRYPSPELWEKIKSAPAQEKRKLIENWSRTPQMDDVHVPNELHVWTNEGANGREELPPFVVYLSTIDVQHNSNLPHFRIKQDALPGKLIPVWFRPTKSNGSHTKAGWKYKRYDENDANSKEIIWEIACAELCGRWHYHMIGKVYVHPSEQNFLAWLREAAARDRATQRTKSDR
jgi:cytochrome c oxidase subunit 2